MLIKNENPNVCATAVKGLNINLPAIPGEHFLSLLYSQHIHLHEVNNTTFNNQPSQHDSHGWFNPLNHHDASKHHFASLQNENVHVVEVLRRCSVRIVIKAPNFIHSCFFSYL